MLSSLRSATLRFFNRPTCGQEQVGHSETILLMFQVLLLIFPANLIVRTAGPHLGDCAMWATTVLRVNAQHRRAQSPEFEGSRTCYPNTSK